MGGVAHAAAAHGARGYVVIDSCTGVSGKITYSPGMVKDQEARSSTPS